MPEESVPVSPCEPLTPAQAAEVVGGSLEGEGPAQIRGIADLASAGPEDASFVRSAPDLGGRDTGPDPDALGDTKAGILLVSPDFATEGRPCIRVEDPILAGAALAAHFETPPPRTPGIHPSAVVENGADVDATASVGPNCVVRAGASVGPEAVLEAGVVVGEDCSVGPGSRLHPGVVLYPGVSLGKACVLHAGTVVGSDGFGFHWDGTSHRKFPHLGTVEIGEGVEIGAGCTIDRGTFQATVIGDGCILDNQVQIGHNCRLGKWVVLCGQVGLGGSTEVGDGVVFGGQSGSGGHVRIGAGVKVAGGSAVLNDVEDGATVGGHPATDLRLDQRAKALLRRMARKKEAALD